MNMELFRAINNLANKNGVLDNIMFFLSKYVPYIFVLIIAILFVLAIIKGDGKCRRVIFSTFIFTVINLVLSMIIGTIFHEDRPFINNKVNLLYPHAKDASFPSDHSIGTMSIALGMGRYSKLLTLILFILSILVGVSRVYVGHHYPMDVLGAYIIVFITSYLYNLKLRKKVEKLYVKVEKKIIKKLGIK